MNKVIEKLLADAALYERAYEKAVNSLGNVLVGKKVMYHANQLEIKSVVVDDGELYVRLKEIGYGSIKYELVELLDA